MKRITRFAGILLLALSLLPFMKAGAQDTIPPLVYDVENTGAECPMPVLPAFEDLPVVKPLTDPFEWSDGSGRDTTFESWECRRNEIKAEIENYEIGPKPGRPDTISATFLNDTLTVTVIENGDTLILISPVVLPEGEGPFPAIIGIGMPSGSLPAEIFSSRDIAMIAYNYTQVMAWKQSRGYEPINALYPDITYMGAYAAWPWGVSRLIDGLELVSEDLPIDLKHLAITGCSFAGKMALFSGAFDERIALTIVQESGGGGAAAWRVMETLEGVERLGSTDHTWFMESMFQFAGRNVSKLPMDHHELMAMVAPRALFVLGNPPWEWLGDEAGYVSCEAARLVWENFGIGDRYGFSYVGDHFHCALPEVQYPEVEAFVDKFLLGDTLVDTDDIDIHPYDYVIPSYWTEWWGSEEPYFPVFDRGESEEVWLEAECGLAGAAWDLRLDTAASNGAYAVPKEELFTTVAPADSGATLYLDFEVFSDTTFYIFGRVNCETFDNDAFFLKVDTAAYEYIYGLRSEGWEWKLFTSVELTAGEHTLALAYREGGSILDKLCISTFYYPPGYKGEPAVFTCEPDTTTRPYGTDAVNVFKASEAYSLGQNYPNPLSDKTTIRFEIPQASFVSLKVHSLLGREMAELAGKEYAAGKHSIDFHADDLDDGVYFYTLKTEDYATTRMMVVRKE